MNPKDDEEKAMPPAKRLAVLRAEMEGRLAALEGGARWDDHGKHVRWLGGEIWDLERISGKRATT